VRPFLIHVRSVISRLESHARSLGDEALALEEDIARSTREIVGSAASTVRASSLRAISNYAQSVVSGLNGANSDIGNLADLGDDGNDSCADLDEFADVEDENDDESDNDNDNDDDGNDRDRGRGQATVAGADSSNSSTIINTGTIINTSSNNRRGAGTGAPRPSSSSSSSSSSTSRQSPAGLGGVDLTTALANARGDQLLAPLHDGASTIAGGSVATEAIGGIDISDVDDDAVRTKYILLAGRQATATRRRLGELRATFARSFPGHSAASVLSAPGPFGFTRAQHDRLTHIHRTEMRACTPAQLADRFLLEAGAGLSRPAVIAHIDWSVRYRAHRRGLNAVKHEWIQFASDLERAARLEASIADNAAEGAVAKAVDRFVIFFFFCC
jgi:hypothetical protein